MSTHILIGICTYKRPQMLMDCLTSLAFLDIPDDVSVSIAVADNECSSQTREIVASHGIQVTYLEAPIRGLSAARNTILSHADEIRPNWIAFLDDDQTAPRDWIIQLMATLSEKPADIICSRVRYLSDNGSLLRESHTDWRVHPIHAGIGTNGVMFRYHLADPQGMGLRFDPRFSTSGGEDRFFFLNARLKGAEVVWTPLAMVDEVVIAAREGAAYMLKRNFRQSWVDAWQDIEIFGRKEAIRTARELHTKKFFRGLRSALFGFLIWPFSRSKAQHKLNQAAYRLGRSCGAIMGLFTARLPNSYGTTQGR